MGRHSKYTEALANTICERLAGGESLRTICSDENLPDRNTVMRWLDAHPDFVAKYARARELQADVLAEQILEIADTPQIGAKTKTADDGKVETTEGDMIEHRRLQVETRKWLAARMAPKKYGDKQQHDVRLTTTLEDLVTDGG